MELWDIYDVDRIPTGRTMARGDEFKPDEYHLVVHICVIRADGKMLIQQRQSFKDSWANMWDVTVGGSSVAGETSRQAAERELLEEIGLKADFSNLRPSFTVNYSRGFDDFYILETQPELSELKLQYEEVQSVAWADKREVLAMIAAGKFIPYRKSLIDLIFDMPGSSGAWTEGNDNL
jgi:isopentenyldiphosphate isomerase